MFCSNCGVALDAGVNYCPNCGTRVKDNAAAAHTVSTDRNDRVMLVSTGDCSRGTACALLQQICGYTAEEGYTILDNTPIVIARGLNDVQARYLAQALSEYGLEVSVYDGDGWREMESSDTSVWDDTGALLSAVTFVLGIIGLDNRITREMMHRMDYPYRYSGARPPVLRLHSALKASRASQTGRPKPAPVRPPVRHAVPPRPASAPQPVPSSRPVPPQRPVSTRRPAPVSQASDPTPIIVRERQPQPMPSGLRPAPVRRPASTPPAPNAGSRQAPRPFTQPPSDIKKGNGRPGGGTGRRG